MNITLCEDLLTSWLSLSTIVRNERLVSSLTFREMLVCHILTRASEEENLTVTATDIVIQTGMLKSQVNKVLVSLESQGYLERCRSKQDKRQSYLHLTKDGSFRYQLEHQSVLTLLQKLVAELGDTKTESLIVELNLVSETMKHLLND